MKLNSKLNSLRQQAGYTLIELSISIAVISVLVVSALYGVQKILDSNKVNQAVKQVSVANVNITKLVAMTNNKQVVDSVGQTINLGAWPDEIVVGAASGSSSGSTARNPFGGVYTVLPASSNDKLTHYVIGIESVPAKLCAATASGMGAIAEHITVESSQSTSPKYGNSNTDGSTVKFSGVFNAASLASQCTGTGNKFIYLFMPFGA